MRKLCDEINGCGTKYNLSLSECPKCGTPEMFSTVVPYNDCDWIYDLECYCNVFTASFKHAATGTRRKYEISDRVNQLAELVTFLTYLHDVKARLVGFNNLGYDYPLLHYIITHQAYSINHADIYIRSKSIIDTPWMSRFNVRVKPWEVCIPQIDLMAIHHFDNKSRRTGLKVIEFNMRSHNIKDLPFKPDTNLSWSEIDELIIYNGHDVDETEKFYIETLDMIEFREELSQRYDRDFINHNDTKIGKDYFIMKLEENAPGTCYIRAGNQKIKRQTVRPIIDLRQAVFPYIQFKTPGFARICEWFKNQVIETTNGVFEDLNVNVCGLQYDFGTGGIHASVNSRTIREDDTYIIKDWDVKSYYPNIAIANRLFPEHLGEYFCVLYKQLYDERTASPKKSAINAMLKLALNGVYGETNQKQSVFFDSLYTMAITINGQLLLCYLSELLQEIPDLEVIQVNTDGLTVKCPRQYEDHMNKVCKYWEDFTLLTLESVNYKTMFIRDVNNYIAVKTNGEVKRIGAYEYEKEWHQDHSALVVPKAVEAYLIHSTPVEEFLSAHTNIHDFMLRAKVGRADNLMIEHGGVDTELQRITRYHVAHNGGYLRKVSPPIQGAAVGQWKRKNGLSNFDYDNVIDELRKCDHSVRLPHELDTIGLPWDERINTKNQSKYKIRQEKFNKGYKVFPCNNMDDFNNVNINYQFYIDEANKLIEPLEV